jgi:cytochrome P450
MLYQLAKHPEWQARVRRQASGLWDSDLSVEALGQLTDIELCMKESLRMCAPVTGLPRVALKDCAYKHYRIPKGAMVMATPYFMGHMEEYWPRPGVFDPERFAPDRREDLIHKYAWIPFGGGVHKCIGLHLAELTIKVIVCRLAERFRWSVADDYQMPLNLISIPMPADDLPVSLRPVGPPAVAVAA